MTDRNFVVPTVTRSRLTLLWRSLALSALVMTALWGAPSAAAAHPPAGDVTIVASGGDALGTTWTVTAGVLVTTAASASVDAATVLGYLASGALTIEANTIRVAASLTSATASDLTLKALRNVTVDPGVAIETAGGDVIVWADSDADRAGGIRVGDDFAGVFTTAIRTNGGDIVLSGGSDPVDGFASYDSALGEAFSVYQYAVGVFGALLDASASADPGGNIVIRGNAGDTFNGVIWTVQIGGQYGANTTVKTNGEGSITILADASEAPANPVANNSRNPWAAVIVGTVETESGDISLIGASNVARSNARGLVIGAPVQSGSGTIRVEDRTANTDDGNYTGPFINGAQFGKGTLPASSSDIVFSHNLVAYASTPAINTTGSVQISPAAGASFRGTLDLSSVSEIGRAHV